MEAVQMNLSCNVTEETSPKELLPPDSPDMNDIFGDPQAGPRVGDEYQVEIPPMITGSERIRLLMDPVDSEGMPYLAHSFLLGLPIPVMWAHEQENDSEDGKGAPSKLGDGAKADESVNSRKCRKGQNLKRKRNSGENAEWSDSRLVNEKESNAGNLDCEMASKTNSFRPCEGKASQLIPGSSCGSWSKSEVDGFLLGLYIFGKNFGQIKRFIESKEMGDILSFYYGAFYRSDRYCRWSDGQKRSRRRNIYGRKIFTGWRQQELLSRLRVHVPDELKDDLLEVSKSFMEGRTSLENYVCHLKASVGICALVEAVGIGKGKADLTGAAMEPPKTSQISPEIPSGKACSSLTSSDIIKLLTGGFRLSKARCNDIFWEAVWPRLLARGWHSEQPKNLCSIKSQHYLVFLMPGIKKFSRRKLVKGNHYFDSVSDVLGKVASEPTLLELDAEGNGNRSCSEENGGVSGGLSDQEDPPDHKPLYLKPRVSVFSSNHIKFTVVDSSLVHGGKASKMRKLRCSPTDVGFTSKLMQKDAQDSWQVNSKHMPSKGNKCVANAVHGEGIVSSSTACHIKFTIVDTSLQHGGKASQLRELRCLPVKVKISSEINNSKGGSEDNSSDDSSREHDPETADRLSNHGSVVSDTKPSCEQVTADNLLKRNKSHSQGKYDKDNSVQNITNSSIEDHGLLIHRAGKTSVSVDTKSKRMIKQQFSRRAKSTHPVILALPSKRRKLTPHAELSNLRKNFSALAIDLAPPIKRQRLAACAKTSDFQEKVSSTGSSAKGNLAACAKTSDFQEKVSSTGSSAKGNPETIETRLTSTEKLSPDVCNGEPGMMGTDGSQCIIGNTNADSLKTGTNACAEEHQTIMNPRRQSTRSRPLTTRVLEALETGFFNMKKTQQVRDVQAQITQFSTSRRARSRVKATPRHRSAAGKTEEAKEGKGTDGAFICSKDILNKPPEVAH